MFAFSSGIFMKNKIKLKINNKQWSVKIVDPKYLRRSYGECDDNLDGSNNKPEIWVRNDLSKKDTFDTLVHEILHAVRPELSEDAVGYTASVICDVIHKIYNDFEKD